MELANLFYSQLNTNKLDDATYNRLKTDISKRGFLDPNIFVSEDGEIVSGNHRVKIAKELGPGYETQLKIFDLGKISDEEKMLLAEMYNTRGGADETLRAIMFYYLYEKHASSFHVETTSDQLIPYTPYNGKNKLDWNAIDKIAQDFVYTKGNIHRMVMLGFELVKNYPWLKEEMGKGVTHLMAHYLTRLDKTTRIYQGDDLTIEDKTAIMKGIVAEAKDFYEKSSVDPKKRHPIGADRIQAMCRSALLTIHQKKLPDLTDVPWASIWYPDKRIESIRHIIEDEVQLGTYSRQLLEMTRSTRVSSFHMSIAFNLIRLLTRDYNEGDQKHFKFRIVDPCCGMGVRVITPLMMGHKAYGYDISKETIDKIKTAYPEYAENFFVHDSVNNTLPFEDNSVDLVFSCPPYWNIEKYEEVPGQLSLHKTYDGFLNDYVKMIEESIRISKQYIVFVVANFRHNGVYYPFCYDTEYLFYKNGVGLHDKIILGHDLSKPTGGTKSLIANHTRSAHDEMFIFTKEL